MQKNNSKFSGQKFEIYYSTASRYIDFFLVATFAKRNNSMFIIQLNVGNESFLFLI